MNQPLANSQSDDQSAAISLIARLPKVALHLHIEGSFEPELMFPMADRNAVPLKYGSVDAVRKAYRFGGQPQHLHRLRLRADDPALLDAEAAVILDFVRPCTTGFALEHHFDSYIGRTLNHRLRPKVLEITPIVAAT